MDLQVGMRDINPEVAKLKHWSSVLSTIFKVLGILMCLLWNSVIFDPNRNGLEKYLFSPMVAQSFFANKVVLSKEARAALRLERCAKSLQFKDVLDDTWKQLDDATKTIGTSHHKSICQVQNDLYIGRGLLCSKCSKANLWNVFCWKKNQDEENTMVLTVCEHKSEYLTLSKEQQDDLLTEFTAWKEMKKTGVRTTAAKSKINDITQTLKAVENELKSLQYHTGAESILYTTCGSTDVPLQGIVFATQGVDNFMDTVMGINNQDLVSKMEGVAIQGMKGSAKNHQKRVSDKCAEICDTRAINRKLSVMLQSQPSLTTQQPHLLGPGVAATGSASPSIPQPSDSPVQQPLADEGPNSIIPSFDSKAMLADLDRAPALWSSLLE
ncbi:uncharacterized protein F5891DRAFT_1189642 [Suillus fuscotomentosus]|uniref:Uncharacterized protein n=1 Tax=Suillus fuscotomentosus TaxID=1912939 RepID=A0AAD4E584_9AGAM|nr:uncharacterized protein F5891DRAFT_1189642 [Suillus fuscotomentosus]KAG1899506.1 hypothetical protein F5891DRAFT_1189642 [Suillus fuscotomentosus]